MSNRRKFAADKDAILMALDQLSQTMEVMGHVVSRLKRSVEQAQMTEHALQHTEIDNKFVDQRQTKIRPEEKQFLSEDIPNQPTVLH